MAYRAEIVEKGNDNTYKVRIMALNKPEGVQGATPNSELHFAPVVTPIGMQPDTYQVGDKVFITFERIGSGKPLILGLIPTSENKDKRGRLNLIDLDVSTTCKLPETIQLNKGQTFVDIDLTTLERLNINIVEKFAELDLQDQGHSQAITQTSDRLGVVEDWYEAYNEKLTIVANNWSNHVNSTGNNGSHFSTDTSQFANGKTEKEVWKDNIDANRKGLTWVYGTGNYANQPLLNNVGKDSLLGQINEQITDLRDPGRQRRISNKTLDGQTTKNYGSTLPEIDNKVKEGDMFYLLLS